MNKIPEKQNQIKYLNLLFAQRYLYSSAKKYFGLRTSIAMVLAIVGPVITSQNNEYSAYVGIVAIFYLLINNLLLEKVEKSKKETASKIQEQFDTELFELPWNDIVAGGKPDSEAIALILTKNPNRNYFLLKDWYAIDVGRIELTFARIFCQRSNAWWDTELRKKYLRLLSAVLFILISSVIILGIYLNLTVGKFVMGVIFPMIPLFELLLKQIGDHINTAKNIGLLKEKLDRTIEDILQKKSNVPLQELSRIFQDEIFRHRKGCPVIFDWVYWIFRDNQEYQMQFSIKNKVKKYLT